MAVRALPPGAIRRRTFFGLLDADGWTAAFFKALFWFLLVLFLLGYIPDRAYYFTVSQTIDVGFNAVPIVNLCPAQNRLPTCPAPEGSIVPWQASPPELALPAPATGAAAFQSGNNLYLIGGLSGGAATADALATRVTEEGNYAPWSEAPPLPEPRSDFALASLSGVPYVIGGLDASGAPTTTVFQGTVAEGALTGWETLTDLPLPVAVSDAMAVPTAAGIYVLGGRTAEGIVDTVWLAAFGESTPPTLGMWGEVALSLPEPRADGSAILVGEQMFVLGGEGPNGVSGSIYRLPLNEGAIDPNEEGQVGWYTALEGRGLPEPRARTAGFTANSVLYQLGGVNADGAPQSSNLWAEVEANGDLGPWQRTDTTDLVEPRAAASVVNVGSFAYLFGGEGASGPVDNSMRANISPEPPFFRLGLFGATIPALAIEGEIGQQLGYINAFGVGMANFVILIMIGWAYSHRQGTMRVIERVSRGRFRAPRDEEYPAFSSARR